MDAADHAAPAVIPAARKQLAPFLGHHVGEENCGHRSIGRMAARIGIGKSRCWSGSAAGRAGIMRSRVLHHGPGPDGGFLLHLPRRMNMRVRKKWARPMPEILRDGDDCAGATSPVTE